MTDESNDIGVLIEMFAKLPGLGPRSSRRLVLHLVKRRNQQLLPIADTLRRVGESVRECVLCGNFCSAEKCSICLSQRRSSSAICVVEDVSDLWALERSGVHKGRYHVLGGLLSVMDNVGPADLRIPDLVERARDGETAEVILALSSTVDGQTTAHYIAEQLEGLGLKVSSLRRGVPVGGELDYLDEGTIAAAFDGRNLF